MSEKRWEKCECGVIDRMLAGKSVKSSRRTWLLSLAAAGICTVSVATLFSAAHYRKWLGRPHPVSGTQPLACQAVHQQLRSFVDNRISDAYLRGMISRHLFTCQACQQAYRGMINSADFNCDAPENS